MSQKYVVGCPDRRSAQEFLLARALRTSETLRAEPQRAANLLLQPTHRHLNLETCLAALFRAFLTPGAKLSLESARVEERKCSKRYSHLQNDSSGDQLVYKDVRNQASFFLGWTGSGEPPARRVTSTRRSRFAKTGLAFHTFSSFASRLITPVQRRSFLLRRLGGAAAGGRRQRSRTTTALRSGRVALRTRRCGGSEWQFLRGGNWFWRSLQSGLEWA